MERTASEWRRKTGLRGKAAYARGIEDAAREFWQWKHLREEKIVDRIRALATKRSNDDGK